MKFYKQLYVGESVKHPEKIKWKLRFRAGTPEIYCIVLAHGTDQLEIVHSAIYLQKYYKKHIPYVIGIAASYKEALDIVVRITQEAVSTNGNGDLKAYLLDEARLHDK